MLLLSFGEQSFIACHYAEIFSQICSFVPHVLQSGLFLSLLFVLFHFLFWNLNLQRECRAVMNPTPTFPSIVTSYVIILWHQNQAFDIGTVSYVFGSVPVSYLLDIIQAPQFSRGRLFYHRSCIPCRFFSITYGHPTSLL